MTLIQYFCAYVPPELIRSCGAVPEFFYPTTGDTQEADPLLPVPFCPFSKILLHELLAGGGNEKIPLFALSCDASRRTWEAVCRFFQGPSPLALPVPFGGGQRAQDRFARELRRLSRMLLSYTGGKEHFLEKRLRDEIHSSLEEKKKVAEQYLSGCLSGGILLDGSATERRNAATKRNTSVLLTASHLLVQPVISFLEARGFTVYEDSPLGMRRKVFPAFSGPLPEDPYLALAQLYLARKAPCPRAGIEQRRIFLLELVKRLKVQGVMALVPKFCDNVLYETTMLQRFLPVPLLLLDHEAANDFPAQWETRLDAFCETLEASG